ncbi:hypothetical protein B0T14DRAFT_566891 [Immersiella caudata]|uniref:Fungal N-terminal domain-containing protein n=1 Tax=Immersiella caudata TaxID=314043 RepID=A0AA39WR82_9PEZI|nr:hypothetical protein B0T14DRAFT_566891 [Immersiella caudata]
MDPLSVAAASVGFADALCRLTNGCFELYKFWESLQDAPQAVQDIKDEIMVLSALLKPMADENTQKLMLPEVVSVLNLCCNKLQVLRHIVVELEIEPLKESRKRDHLRAKFRLKTKAKELETFLDRLRNLKNTLTLGLIATQPRILVTNEAVDIQIHQHNGTLNPSLTTNISAQAESTSAMISTRQSGNSFPVDLIDTSGELQVPKDADASILDIASNPKVQNFLAQAMHRSVEDMLASGILQQVLLSAMHQPSSFETGYSGSFDPNGLNMHKKPSTTTSDHNIGNENKPPPHKTSMGVMFGSIWIRTSSLKAAAGCNVSNGDLEVVTSFIFYPKSWLGRFGLRRGVEANLHWSGTTGWKFNIKPIRAVPENAYIFRMCEQGNIAAVKDLLSSGDASLMDTSPKGWTPLHFAARNGRVELCSYLIGTGADRQALAFEGPTEDALTPLGIWSEFCGATPSKRKIEMIDAFGAECLDVSELHGDGWVVGHNLIKHMSLEECDMAETAVQWVYTKKQEEILVALGANSIWHGLQQAVRGFLVEEHGRAIVRSLLQKGGRMGDLRWHSRVNAIGHLLALRASGRKLLPLIVQACQCLQVDGFDPMPPEAGSFGVRELNKSLPVIYTTWAKTSPVILSNVSKHVEAELEELLTDMSLDRDGLAQCISQAVPRDVELESSGEADEWFDAVSYNLTCLDCGDDYSTLGKGLVQPRRISFDECRTTRHKHYCECIEFLAEKGVTPTQQFVSVSGDLEGEAEEEIHKEVEVDVGMKDKLCETYDTIDTEKPVPGDPFYDAASMLYRAQGRRWIGSYKPSEALCGACFLKREKYIGPKGPADGSTHFTPVLPTHVSACPPEYLGASFVVPSGDRG